MGREIPKPGEELVKAKTTIYAALNDPKTLAAIQKSLPEIGVTADRVATIAFSVIASKPSLMKCDVKSLIKVIIEGSLLGLSFDPHLKQAAIVPFKDQATLIVEYMGLVKLARNSGVLKYVNAEIVYENDLFEYTLGLDPNLQHTPPKKGERGKPIGAYAVGALVDGDKVFKFLNEAEINFYREKSRAKDASDSPWNTDPLAMWRKTVIRRLVGYLPMDDKTARAAADDELAETGHDQILAPEVFGGDYIDVQPTPATSKTDETKEKLKDAKKQAEATTQQLAGETTDERGDLISLIGQLWPKLWRKVVEADVEVSAATGGAIQSLAQLEENGTLEHVKQVATHFRALRGEA